jgi:hypothetical protein
VKALLTELAHGQMREQHGTFCYGLEVVTATLDREIEFLEPFESELRQKGVIALSERSKDL